MHVVLLEEHGADQAHDRSLMRKYARKNEAVSRLVTFPGIGQLGASAIIADVGVGRLRKARNLAAWVGLVPAQHTTEGQTDPSGHWQTRQSLRAAADHSLREIVLFASRPRKHRTEAVVALANKLTRIIWANRDELVP